MGRAAFRTLPFFCFISLPSLPHSSNIDLRLQCHVRHAVLNLALKRIAAVFPFHIATQKHSCRRSKKIKDVWLFYILIVLFRSVNCTNSHPYLPCPQRKDEREGLAMKEKISQYVRYSNYARFEGLTLSSVNKRGDASSRK